MKVELLSVRDCPHVTDTRKLLHSCLSELGLDVVVHESVGDFPSPTVLVDGTDVMGDPGFRSASCRIDVPTRAAILRALRAT